ncbi:MAG: ABC transporter substrate-binding protein [Muribaculaceae bacterium]
MTKYVSLLAAGLCALMLCACANSGKQQASAVQNQAMEHSQLLQITRNERFTRIDIADPWHKGKTLQTYIAVPLTDSLPSDLPKGTLLRTPLQRALVYSSVHAQAIKELGKIPCIAGVCDAQYYKIPEIVSGLKAGTVTDAGSSMAPTIEKVVEMRPDVVILSPFQNGGYGVLTTLGVPILECADYMESSPLGRAEWIKLFGILFDAEDDAQHIYEQTVHDYDSIATQVANAGNHPKVITEMLMSGVWFVPGGNSYMARILTDAGANYPWANVGESGSLQLDFAQVLDCASDADVWLINSSTIKTYAQLKQAYELNARFKAFTNKNVWVCDPQQTMLYEEFPFHPDRLLKEFATIFNSGNAGEAQTRYYKPLGD